MGAKSPGDGPGPRRGLLDWIEWIGNKLPDPTMLFLGGAAVVMLLSAVAAQLDWSVQPRVYRATFDLVLAEDGTPRIDEETGAPRIRLRADEQGRPILELTADLRRVEPQFLPAEHADAVAPPRRDAAGEPIVVLTGESGDAEAARPRSLLTSDGLFWCLKNMVPNFMNFPPLGVVLVGMLGIGVAEKTGLLAAALKAFVQLVPGPLLTPAMIFLGVMSSLGVDAGYVVLPPLAAALYLSVGRSPLVGVAAVFAGVSAGFNANLVVTGLDPMLAGFTTMGARVFDAGYEVAPTCNWWFMIASTFVITAAGWAVTAWIVDRRFRDKSPEDGGPRRMSAAEVAEARHISSREAQGLLWAGLVLAVLVTGIITLSVWPQSPLYGVDSQNNFPRWVAVIVPLIFLSFLLPGVVFGAVVGKVRSGRDLAGLMHESMSGMAPIIVLAFFAAQFIEYFRYSQLDRMLALAGGQWLAAAALPSASLIVAFVLVTALFNLFVGSMSAKYAMFAPVFVPMFMMVGISPELTQAAYRIGDSATNVITPLNSYLVIVLVYMQRFVPKAGMGTLISMMLPYSVVFLVTWLLLLLVWLQFGWDLGWRGPLTYTP
ncbi:MAG: AbgT family transporter [Phycisphaerales bacterium]|nr:AbgT family transporter [Phycisphaerales bacterium]